MAGEISLPGSFVDMPRWWSGDTGWLAALPGMVRAQCATWGLRIAGGLSHGSNAIAVPVTRAGEAFMLRMTPPGPDVADQVRALRFWDGRGTVQLIEADIPSGAMLLERLCADQSLTCLPAEEASAVLGAMMRRLAVPQPPPVVPSTAAIARSRAGELEREWHRLHQPFDLAILAEAQSVAAGLSITCSDLAVNGDLHSGQVLRGSREPWLTVDPVLLRGDIEYDLARVLWTRIDEMAGNAGITRCFDAALREAGLDRDRARDWVVFRAVDYWLWGLSASLTIDPPRCHRLIRAFVT
jgi:streptomycin 6-kinase